MRTGLLLVTLLAACGTVTDPQESSDATPAPDANPNAPDADPTLPDADPSVPDATPGAPDATPIPTTTVQFRNSNAPVADAVALLYGPDGALIKDTTTNADGEVRFDNVVAGSSITVGKPIGAFGPRVATIFDVQPGDTIAVGDYSDTTTNNIAVSIPFQAGVSRYHLGAGCGRNDTVNAVTSGNTFTQLRALVSCKKTDGWTVVAVAIDSANRALKQSIARSVTGSVTLSSWTDITPTAGLDDLTASYTNAPADQMNAQLTLLFPFPAGGTTAIGGFTTPTAQFRFRYPPNVVDKLRWSVESRADNESSIVIFRNITPALTSSINIGAEGFPIPATLTQDFTNSARPKFTWSTPADGADMIFFRGQWTGSGGPMYDWQAFAPPGTSTAQMPAIPSGHGELLPPAPGSGIIFSGEVSVIDTIANGWNPTRQDPVRLEVTRRSFRGKTLR